MLCRPGSSEAVLSSHLARTAAGRARGNIGTRPTRMGTRLHGMASRAEEIELNRGRSRKNLVGGTDGSNLVPSSEESAANLTCVSLRDMAIARYRAFHVAAARAIGRNLRGDAHEFPEDVVKSGTALTKLPPSPMNEGRREIVGLHSSIGSVDPIDSICARSGGDIYSPPPRLLPRPRRSTAPYPMSQ